MGISRRFWAPVAFAMIGSMSLYGQFHLGKDKEKDKSDVIREKEQKREEKNVRMYDKIKAYAHEKYDSDLEFHDLVEEEYRGLLRDDMEEAKNKNLHRRSYMLEVHEDRFRIHEELYDNLLVQDEINRLGQSLVPANSDRVFAFKLTPDPTPMARTLATGTIYISTGMVALLDTQAQLAYVLAHEMAHVQLDHWKDRVIVKQGLEAYNSDQGKKAERVALYSALAGAAIGGVAGRSATAAALGGVGGGVAGLVAGALMNRHADLSWDHAQEDEADKMAFKIMLNSRYDVREIPKVYATLEAFSSRDQRITLGFLGERNRIRERKENVDKLIQQSYKAEIEAGMRKGFNADTGTHRNLMAELKRDNGIMAYYSDMFEVARMNLSDAVAIRDNDPVSEYFYGKTLETIGRSDEDRKLAIQCFQKAVQFDFRKQDFGAHLHYALALLEDDKHSDQKRISAELDDYMTAWFAYLREDRKAKYLPPSIDSILDYTTVYGQVNWQPKLPIDLQDLQVNFNSSQARQDGNAPPSPATTVKSDSKPTAQPASAPARGVLNRVVSPRP